MWSSSKICFGTRFIFILYDMVSISNKLFFLPFANNRIYSCLGKVFILCVCVSVYACVCVHDNSKNNGSFNLKFEHMIACKNSSDKFHIGRFEHCRKIKFSKYVHKIFIYTHLRKVLR